MLKSGRWNSAVEPGPCRSPVGRANWPVDSCSSWPRGASSEGRGGGDCWPLPQVVFWGRRGCGLPPGSSARGPPGGGSCSAAVGGATLLEGVLGLAAEAVLAAALVGPGAPSATSRAVRRRGGAGTVRTALTLAGSALTRSALAGTALALAAAALVLGGGAESVLAEDAGLPGTLALALALRVGRAALGPVTGGQRGTRPRTRTDLAARRTRAEQTAGSRRAAGAATGTAASGRAGTTGQLTARTAGALTGTALAAGPARRNLLAAVGDIDRQHDQRGRTTGVGGAQLDPDAVTQGQPADHEQTHAARDRDIHGGRRGEPLVDRREVLGGEADTGVVDLDEHPPVGQRVTGDPDLRLR